LLIPVLGLRCMKIVAQVSGSIKSVSVIYSQSVIVCSLLSNRSTYSIY